MHLRGEGCALSTAGLWTSSPIIMSVSPIAVDVMDERHYLVSICGCVVAAASIRIWWPEVSPTYRPWRSR
jgi:hypothetical protein